MDDLVWHYDPETVEAIKRQVMCGGPQDWHVETLLDHVDHLVGVLEHIARKDWSERFLSDDEEWNEVVREFGNYPRGVARAALEDTP